MKTPSHPMTLESLAAQKAEIRSRLAEQRQVIIDLGHRMVAPVEQATTRMGAVTRAFHTGMALFDGLMMGLKIMRRLRRMVQR